MEVGLMSDSLKWEFAARFRRGAFGWKSQPAITRVKEAVAEIKKVARHDLVLAADGAVLFLCKISPALERVDSSSGAIGTAVNNAIEALVPIIAKAPAEVKLRMKWLERLWEALQEDRIPYIEHLGELWGDLCATPSVASRWADELIGTLRMAWSSDPSLMGHFAGTYPCLSALYAAGRYKELLDLVDHCPYRIWHYRRWGVKALVAMGRKEQALSYAEESPRGYEGPMLIAQACEEILLSDGRADEAYRRYAMEANRRGTNLATFRAIAQKYPHLTAGQILNDLAAGTPGEEGKWFAAAKSAGLLGEALELARRSPCDPKTLTRAARDFAESNPLFAIEAGMTALLWLVRGYGYEITGLDVWAAHDAVMKAAESVGRKEETVERMRVIVAEENGDHFVSNILGRTLGLR
jgi:hypothetical protein